MNVSERGKGGEGKGREEKGRGQQGAWKGIEKKSKQVKQGKKDGFSKVNAREYYDVSSDRREGRHERT